MDQYHLEDFYKFRNRLLNDALLGTAIVATPSVIASLARMTSFGWKPIMALHLALLATLWILWLARTKCSYNVRISGILGTLILASFGGLIQLGPAAAAQSFVIVAAFISMLFLSPRTAWIIVGLNMAGLTILGIAATQSLLHFDLDFTAYSHHPSTWITLVWTLSSFGTMLAYIVWRMVDELLKRQKMAEQLISQQQVNLNIIQRGEQRLMATVEGSPNVAIQWYDLAGKVLYWNHASEILYGWTAAEAQGKSLDKLFYTPDENSKFVARLHEIHASGKTSGPDEITIRHRDGTVRIISATFFSIQGDTDPIFVSLDIDITRQKEIDHLKNEFISLVSHELRTPLTSIYGSLGLIAGGVTGPLSEQTKKLIEVAHKNSERLISLINDILDIDKIESGKMSFDFSQLEIMPLIHQAKESNESFALQHNVKLEISSTLPHALVNVDCGRMIQIMTNLLSNAIKFSHPDSIVEISVKRINGSIRTSVSDKGSGIPEHFKAKVFSKFSQADSSATRQKGGTGLGLSITKLMVEKMQGSIAFESQPDIGTTFYFDLPEVTQKH